MHHHGNPLMTAFAVWLVAIGAVAYLLLAFQQHANGRGWKWRRTGSYMAGSALLILGLSPKYLPFAADDFRQHMLEHLLMGMYAPIGFVMAAPVTLLLRTLPVRYARLLTALLRNRVTQLLANPVSALILDFGGMAALYFTPLYARIMSDTKWQYVMHFHLVAAGCLFVWVIAGPDPAPHRISVPMRLVVLGVAVIIHSVLAQMLYAGTYVAVPVAAAERERSAELMYYGGDISEMLLAFALVTAWRPGQRRRSPYINELRRLIP